MWIALILYDAEFKVLFLENYCTSKLIVYIDWNLIKRYKSKVPDTCAAINPINQINNLLSQRTHLKQHISSLVKPFYPNKNIIKIGTQSHSSWNSSKTFKMNRKQINKQQQ